MNWIILKPKIKIPFESLLIKNDALECCECVIVEVSPWIGCIVVEVSPWIGCIVVSICSSCGEEVWTIECSVVGVFKWSSEFAKIPILEFEQKTDLVLKLKIINNYLKQLFLIIYLH